MPREPGGSAQESEPGSLEGQEVPLACFATHCMNAVAYRREPRLGPHGCFLQPDLTRSCARGAVNEKVANTTLSRESVTECFVMLVSICLLEFFRQTQAEEATL